MNKVIMTLGVLLFFVLMLQMPSGAAAFNHKNKMGQTGGAGFKKNKEQKNQSTTNGLTKKNKPLIDQVKGAFMARRANLVDMKARGFMETGLRPVYPTGLNCQIADSLFASGTRGNGTQRSNMFFQGYHGGMDIPGKGIDILAMADGEVIAKNIGDNIGGIKIVLRHSPQNTGLNVWAFTEYKHMKEPSDRPLNSIVRMGDVLGVAWNTGTTGGKAYGISGNYGLHVSTWYNDTGDYKSTPRLLIPKQGFWMDPLAMLRGLPVNSEDVKNLNDDQKQFPLSYKTADGNIVPENAKVIWPFACI